MSEFHPNRTRMVRTRPKLTARRILECWPLLIWLAVGALGVSIYKSGVVFSRMNGAVDVYSENITPISEGRLHEIKVTRGQRVAPGTVVAVMDAAPYQFQLESLKREIIAERTDDINDYALEIYKLESDLRDIETADAEDTAIITELKDSFGDKKNPGGTAPAAASRSGFNFAAGVDNLRYRLDFVKASGRNGLTKTHRDQVTAAIDSTKAAREKLLKDVELISKPDVKFEEITRSAVLRADEERMYSELKTQLDQCQLVATHGGIVDRLEKEIGEFVATGESILKIVGDPEHIIAFLPQDQANDLTAGTEVWVASTSDKSKIFVSVVEGVSPRINNLADATSPLPNQRIHGRDVIIKYPKEALPAKPEDIYGLLPGQTVVIHRNKPGSVPLLNRLFPSDDTVR